MPGGWLAAEPLVFSLAWSASAMEPWWHGLQSALSWERLLPGPFKGTRPWEGQSQLPLHAGTLSTGRGGSTSGGAGALAARLINHSGTLPTLFPTQKSGRTWLDQKKLAPVRGMSTLCVHKPLLTHTEEPGLGDTGWPSKGAYLGRSCWPVGAASHAFQTTLSRNPSLPPLVASPCACSKHTALILQPPLKFCFLDPRCWQAPALALHPLHPADKLLVWTSLLPLPLDSLGRTDALGWREK